MNIIINILLVVALVAGAIALFVYFDMIEMKLLGSPETFPVEDSKAEDEHIENLIGSKYAVYIVSIAVGALMEIGNAVGGHFILGFHGFWSSLCTLLPLLIFATFAFHVNYVFETEQRISRVVGHLLFIVAACVLGFLAGAVAMAFIIFVVCLIVSIWLFLKLLSISATSGSSSSYSSAGAYSASTCGDEENHSTSSKYDTIIENGGIFGNDIGANRNCDGSLTDEYGRRWEGDMYGNYHKC